MTDGYCECGGHLGNIDAFSMVCIKCQRQYIVDDSGQVPAPFVQAENSTVNSFCQGSGGASVPFASDTYVAGANNTAYGNYYTGSY